ncbi:MAG: hypothetical protein JNJ77_05220 [Planctomycetia bacterium]|nr:hypothetical protein [Planctomycetia bacterium]
MGPPSINNLGQVSFHSSRDAGGNGVFRGVGVPVSPVNIALTGATYSGFGRNTANNESGQVAFRAGIVSGGDALLIGNGISTITVATTSGPFFAFDALSINDSGQVAFSAMNDDGSFGVYFYNGSTISTIATTSSYSRFGSVNLSNSGMVAFYAEVANSIDQGIFFGPNPAINKLIRVGDNLDGGIVGNIAFSPFGLNNNNQFAFTASVGSGTGIYLATAVPEPVTIALVFLIAAGAGAACWRTRAIFHRMIHQEVELPE